jgi:hypothetical protein
LFLFSELWSFSKPVPGRMTIGHCVSLAQSSYSGLLNWGGFLEYRRYEHFEILYLKQDPGYILYLKI